MSGRHWNVCDAKVHEALEEDMDRDCGPMVEKVLNMGLNVLVYNGDKDFICNWLGGFAWVNSLNWKYSQEFVDTPLVPRKGGEYKSLNNLEFFRIYEAGHMVPLDQP